MLSGFSWLLRIWHCLQIEEWEQYCQQLEKRLTMCKAENVTLHGVLAGKMKYGNKSFQAQAGAESTALENDTE